MMLNYFSDNQVEPKSFYLTGKCFKSTPTMCEGIFPCFWDTYRLIKQEYEPITRIVNTAENLAS